MSEGVVCRASPNLALIKYWGKRSRGFNRPATPSLGVSLKDLYTETRVSLIQGQDELQIEGQPIESSQRFFNGLRRRLNKDLHFKATSRNNFSGSAGLASSSSGFAALTCACVRAAGAELPAATLSELARQGSVSAARAVFPGFVLLPAGARAARHLFPPDYWPTLRIIVVTVASAPKELSSREAMEWVRWSSPFYPAWVKSAPRLLKQALEALEKRDLPRLGEAMQASYLSMFGTMLAARPPILYWLPGSIALIQECQRLRKQGIQAWETMDAGPQVKIFCLQEEAEGIAQRVRALAAGLEDEDWQVLVTQPGAGPRLWNVRDDEGNGSGQSTAAGKA